MKTICMNKRTICIGTMLLSLLVACKKKDDATSFLNCNLVVISVYDDKELCESEPFMMLFRYKVKNETGNTLYFPIKSFKASKFRSYFSATLKGVDILKTVRTDLPVNHLLFPGDSAFINLLLDYALLEQFQIRDIDKSLADKVKVKYHIVESDSLYSSYPLCKPIIRHNHTEVEFYHNQLVPVKPRASQDYNMEIVK